MILNVYLRLSVSGLFRIVERVRIVEQGVGTMGRFVPIRLLYASVRLVCRRQRPGPETATGRGSIAALTSPRLRCRVTPFDPHSGGEEKWGGSFPPTPYF